MASAGAPLLTRFPGGRQPIRIPQPIQIGDVRVLPVENPAELRTVMHPGLGIALIDLDRSESCAASRRPARLAVRGVWPVPPPGTLTEETGPTRGRSGHACDQSERIRRTRRPAGRGGGHTDARTG